MITEPFYFYKEVLEKHVYFRTGGRNPILVGHPEKFPLRFLIQMAGFAVFILEPRAQGGIVCFQV